MCFAFEVTARAVKRRRRAFIDFRMQNYDDDDDLAEDVTNCRVYLHNCVANRISFARKCHRQRHTRQSIFKLN